MLQPIVVISEQRLAILVTLHRCIVVLLAFALLFFDAAAQFGARNTDARSGPTGILSEVDPKSGADWMWERSAMASTVPDPPSDLTHFAS